MFELSSVTSFLAFTLFITILLRLIYTLIVKNWNFFSDRNIVFERGLPVAGTLFGDIKLILGKKSSAESVQDVYNKHPDRSFIGIYDIGGRPSYMIRDPDLINKIAIKDFDHFVNHFFKLDKELDPLMGRLLFSMSNQPWRDMRATLSPLFTGSKMRHMLALMTECTNDFNTSVRNEILSRSKTNSLEYDMNDLMMRLTNDIIGSTAFGFQMNTMDNADNEFFKMGKELAYIIQSVRGLIYMAFPKMATLFKLRMLPDRIDHFFRSVINSAITERQNLKIKRNDMLNLLLLAKEGKLDEIKEKESDQDTGFATVAELLTPKKSEILKNWTEDDLVSQCLIFFLAGFTGISLTLSFMFNELSVNVHCQDRLYEEIVEIDEELNGKPVTFEALQKMKYLDMVISETLRKWPLGFLMDRQCNKQYLMEDHDGTKVLVQPNDICWVPVYGIQRDPLYWYKPDTFDPERFSDENKHKIRSGTYIPFGVGPRACIGNRFALLQVKAIAYNMLKDFKVECSPKTENPLKLTGASLALNIKGGFFNQLTLRN